MAGIHITDMESAINWWREKERATPAGLLELGPEVQALAQVYALMVYYRETECDEDSMPAAAKAPTLKQVEATLEARLAGGNGRLSEILVFQSKIASMRLEIEKEKLMIAYYQLWLALACLLVLEGLFPFLSPGGWRRAWRSHPNRSQVRSEADAGVKPILSNL